jgi:uncharacterized protein YndB with AHSA1/START domain
MPEAVTAHEVTITRVYDAPRELVWKAWTEPDRLATWWGPRGWSTRPDDVTLDVRTGGAFHVLSRSDEDGSEMTTEGVYTEVRAPDRLAMQEPSEDAWHEGAKSEITLRDLGGGRTEMAFRATVHTTDEMRAVMTGGLNSAFDRLGEHLA